MRLIRLIFRLILFMLWTLILIPPQIVILFFTKQKLSLVIPQLWCRGVLYIANTTVKITGVAPSTDHCFFVGNHISSMDIPILGSVLFGSFVAKADVESYPLFGFLGHMQQAVFISRKSSAAKIAQDQIRQILYQGKNIILFPEGTSTDGTYVVPFKSTLFSIPIEMADSNIVIQPFTLSLLTIEGLNDLSRARRNLFALTPEVEFLQNFLSIMSLAHAEVNLHLHPPIPVSPTSDRKIIADQAYKAVVSALK